MASWDSYYEYTPANPMGIRGGIRNWAIKSIQRDLVLSHEDPGEVDGIYGAMTRAAVIGFQRRRQILMDGVVGPITAKRLCQRRILGLEISYVIPRGILCGLVKMESNFDYGATGYADMRDRGLVQINSHWHPDVTDKEAFDNRYSLRWAARYLTNSMKFLKDWDCAVASYHLGLTGAKKWCAEKEANTEATWYVETVKKGC